MSLSSNLMEEIDRKSLPENANEALSGQKGSKQDLLYLADRFSKSAVAVLQNGGQGDWIHMRELLQIIEPVGNVMLDFSQVKHYLGRVYEHVYSVKDTSNCLNISEILKTVFSHFEFSQIPTKCSSRPAEPERSKDKKKCGKKEKISNNNYEDIFKLDAQFIDRKLEPKQVKLTDIYKCLPRVVAAIARHESIWKNCLGLTLVATNTDIPFEIVKEDQTLPSELQDSLQTPVTERIPYQIEKGPKTGYAVVESLVKSHSVNTTRIWYLNFADSEHYKPYDLVVVSKNRVHQEHFVISVFGVLHVKSDGQSELIPLGQWYREATVYKTIIKINYFRTYLIFKTFMLWRKNTKFNRFCKIRKRVKETHFLEIPSMREATIMIKHMIHEMEGVSPFPNDTKCSYTLAEFQNTVLVLLHKARKQTEKIYKNCQAIVSKVENECLAFLEYCEAQLEQKGDNIKESMTVARDRRNQQMHNLKIAKYMSYKLPCFVRLTELMLQGFMINFICKSISAFVHNVIKVQDRQKKGFFNTSFVFDLNSSLLAMSPSPETLEKTLKLTFDNASLALSEVCSPLHLLISNENDDDLAHADLSNASREQLSVDELQILLNYNAKEANAYFKQNDQQHSPDVSINNAPQLDPQMQVDEEKTLLQNRVAENKEVKDCYSSIHIHLQSEFLLVDKFIQKHNWIAKIHKFVSTWSNEVLESWKGKPAWKIEKTVQQINSWIEQVHHIEWSITTPNGLLYIDGSGIQEMIVPGLKNIFEQLMDMIAQDCLTSSKELIKELDKLSKMLSTSKSTLEEFTSFFIQLKECKEVTLGLQNRVEYTNSLFEVVRHCYRQLSTDEEAVEVELHNQWDTFLYVLQEANDDFDSLAPQMLENLEKKISELGDEASEITSKVTSGKFLDADEEPKQVLPELQELHSRFMAVKEELTKLAKCKEIIADEPHDLTALTSMYARIIARHELWKYCDVSAGTIKEWLQTPFNKLQVKKVIEKVSKWKDAATKLRQDIPLNDEVLERWVANIDDFCVELPLLLELSSVPLKARHWKWLFAGLGQIYDQSYQYLVADLISMGLRDHVDLVTSICDGAGAEYALESHLKKLIRKWEEEEFKLMKHFESAMQKRRQHTNTKKDRLKLLNSSKRRYKGAASSRDMFIITGVNELQFQVEDSLVTLQSMLASPNLAEMRHLAETWSGYIHQLKEILDLWITAQHKWLYLGKIFNDEKMMKIFMAQLEKYEEIDAKYREHMAAVLRDPNVLSVLEKKRGEKGYRELQGENLRTFLIQLITEEEEAIKSLGAYLEKIRSSFPRLYFLSDNELLELLASTRNPKRLVPFVKKCFPGITNLKLVLPQSLNNRVRTQLDVALNAHELEVVGFYGKCGEELKLSEPVSPNPSTEMWLKSIETAMKKIVWSKMGQCIEERMLCTPSIKELLRGIGLLQSKGCTEDEIARPSSARRRLSLDDSDKAFWYMVYPFQCVTVAEEVIWTSKMMNAIDIKGFEEIEDVRRWVENNISQYSSALQSSFAASFDRPISKKAVLLIQSLLVRSLYQREVTENLNRPDINELSFEWLQCLKYQIDITHDRRKRVHDRHGKTELLYGASNTAVFGRLYANQLEHRIPYGYEYHGPNTRLIITPLTDRCLLNLTAAIRLRYGGLIYAGTQAGKTETIQEMAKLFGSHLVTFTCSPALSLSKVLHFISGAIQSGSLICLDNITELPVAFLSVLGQHLDALRQALSSLERRKYCQYELRDNNLKKNLADDHAPFRKRGITVISLHTLVINDAGSRTYITPEETKKKREKRRSSVAEIKDIPDPRKDSGKDTKLLVKSKSEFKMRKPQFEAEENTIKEFNELEAVGNVMFSGHLMKAHPLYGCLMTTGSKFSKYQHHIPDNLKTTLRSISMVLPDYQHIIEALLICQGFKSYLKLSKKLCAFRSMYQSQFFDEPVKAIGLGQIKSIVAIAGNGYRQLKSQDVNKEDKSLLHNEDKLEEYCMAQALYNVLSTSVNLLDYPSFLRLLKVSFPACKDSLKEQSSVDELLLSSVKQQILSDSLLDKKEFIDKVMQLHTTMHQNRSIILLGHPGSGKTACYQTLCRALCQFYSTWSQAIKKKRQTTDEQSSDKERTSTGFSKVNLSTIYHKALTHEELFGGVLPHTEDWLDGLLPKLLRNTVQLQNASDEKSQERSANDSIQHWFVFDGPLDTELAGKMESLLDHRNELCLTNGERIMAPDSVRFLFETDSLCSATPALVSRSAVVNFETTLVDWRCIFHSWKTSACNKFNISTTGLKTIENLLHHINEPLVEFLANNDELLSPTLLTNNPTHPGKISVIAEISSVLQMLSAVFERFLSRETAERTLRRESLLSDAGPPHSDRSSCVDINFETKFVSNAFSYAFVWAIAGRIPASSYQQLDTFTRQLFSTCPDPVIFPCPIFEAVFDSTCGELIRSQGKPMEITKTLSSQIYTVSPEIERYFTVADLLLSSGCNLLLAGEPGVGKTSFVKNLLMSKHKFHHIVVSHGLTPSFFQSQIQSIFMERQNRFRANPLKLLPQVKGTGANKNLFFIDDVSLAAGHNDGGQLQPTLEVLRQMISEGGVYDRERKFFQHLPGLQFIAACAPPGCYGKGGPVRPLSRRLTRRMTVINMVSLSSESMASVYESIFKSWLEEFPAYSLTHIEPLAKALSRASVQMYSQVKEKLVFIPSCPHYIFSQHDLARLAKGVFIYSPKSRLRVSKSKRGLLDKETIAGYQSMPELTNSNRTALPDTSISTTIIDQNNTTENIDCTPAAISPLIRVIVRLWCHEVIRTFHDRILEEADKQWFSSALKRTVILNFCGNVEEKATVHRGQGILSKDSIEKKANKNSVKFKDIEITRQSDYRGPLISLKHLLGDDDRLTDISFSKHLFIYGSRGVEGAGDHDKGYVECSDDHLEEGLRKSLRLINSSDEKKFDLVLYREALHHAVRISRILALPGGHALLISLRGHGRANIVKLVAKLANIKVMEVNGDALRNRSKFRSIVKDACLVSGLQSKHVVLFIPEGLGREGLEDIAALLVQGTCPGLYTPEELNAIGNHLLPGGQVGQRRTESKTVAQERFLRRVRSNLHVVICAWHGSLANIIGMFPTILSRASCVDIYREWTQDILTEVAEKWLLGKGKNEFFYGVPWDLDSRDKQLSAIYATMAKIHLTSRATLDEEYRALGLEIFSPLKFVEFVDLFRTLCNIICSEKEEELSRLKRATGKVEEGKSYIRNVEGSLSELTPVLESCRADLKASEMKVNAAKKDYHDSREACDIQQKEIDKLELPLKKLKEEAHEELGKLNPIYEAAMKALDSLDIHDVEEIRSYRDPPHGVKKVADILCTMFNRPTNWEDAKLLLLRDNFFQELLFYNKDDIPDSVYRNLKKYAQDQETSPQFLSQISQAASSLSTWVRAIYQYGSILRSLNPKKSELKEAEKRLNEAKSLLGERRVRNHELKNSLENEIEAYKEKMRETRSLEKQIQSLNRVKHKANELLDSMNLYIDHWQENTAILKKKLATAPGDALLVAATVCYLGTFSKDVRDSLLNSWRLLCLDGVEIRNGSRKEIIAIPIDDKFSFVDILSSDNELVSWKKKGLPSDSIAVVNGLIARACCFATKKCWPLLIDPHDQATQLVKCLEEGSSVNATSSASLSATQQATPTRTLLNVILEQNLSSQRPSQNSRQSTKGNFFSTTFTSDTLRTEMDGCVRQTHSSADGRESEMARTPDVSDSAMSNRRPRTAYSSFSAITNESIFLKKFYTQTGLKNVEETPPASPLIDLVEDTLLIVEADSDGIDKKLKSAVAKGVPTLITHLERGIHGSFLDALIERKIQVSESNNLFISHGKRAFDYNPNFRLYLSASVPMDFNKTNKFVLPLHKAVVVNMAISQEGLRDQLVSLTISAERPELESQRRSLEFDLFYLREEKRQIQSRILDLIIGLPGKLLEETSLPDIMADSKNQLNITRERYDEGKQYQKELDAKRSDYYEVAVKAATLFTIVDRLSNIKSNYTMPLYFFIDLFKRTLRESKRSKSDSGSVAARAAELNNKFMSELYKRVCINIFKEHVLLFPYMVVIENMVKEGSLSLHLQELFAHLISFSDKRPKKGSHDDKSEFLADDVLQRVTILDQCEKMKGISESLIKQEMQWKEYFDASPNLLCSCPCGFEGLGSFHKMLLWIAAAPEKLCSIIRSFILCHLGPEFTVPVVHKLDEIYQESKFSTPILLMLPDDDEIAKEDPTLSIRALARSKNIHVVKISLGLKYQLREAVRLMKDAVKNNSWIILQNCHLETEWSPEILREIEEITYAEDENAECCETDGSLHNKHRSMPSFRLWLTIKCHEKLTIPVTLARKGFQVAWDVTNWNTRNVPVTCHVPSLRVSDGTRKCIQEFSALHYKMLDSEGNDNLPLPYQGSTSDLRFGIELLAHISNMTEASKGRKINNALILPVFQKMILAPKTGSDTRSNCDTVLENKIEQKCDVPMSEQDSFRSGDKIYHEDPRSLRTSMETLFQKRYQKSNDQRILPRESSAIDVGQEIRSVLTLLSRKTNSHSCKSLYAFFYREIEYQRQFALGLLREMELVRCSVPTPDRIPFKYDLEVYEAIQREKVEHLKNCVDAVISYTRPRSRQPLGYDMNCIVHPCGFFASILEDFCHEQLLDVGNTSWDCFVLEDTRELLPPVTGVYLRNLKLINAVWNFGNKSIDLKLKTKMELPIVYMVPSKEGKSSLNCRNGSFAVICPLRVCKENRTNHVLSVHILSSVKQYSVTTNNVMILGNCALFRKYNESYDLFL